MRTVGWSRGWLAQTRQDVTTDAASRPLLLVAVRKFKECSPSSS
jgi:hypothetical protein